MSFSAVELITMPVLISTLNAAIAMTPITSTAYNDLRMATGTVVESGTGGDSYALALLQRTVLD